MDVVGLGLCTVDHLFIVDRPPTFERGSSVRGYSTQGGGPVATALAALGKLGANVGFVGRIGDDPAGEFIRQEFHRYNVDTSHLGVQPGAVSSVVLCLVSAETGDRSFSVRAGTAKPLSIEEIDREYLLSGKFLHLDGFSGPSLAAAKLAREAGVHTVYDAGYYGPGAVELIRFIDTLIASEYFARSHSNKPPQEIALEMLDLGPRTACITLGDKGCVVASREGVFHQPAFEVDVVDTTGAGDVFHGAFIYGLLRGYSLRHTAEFASAVAAIKCTKIGGRQGIPTVPEVEAFLRTARTR
jgi:ribokinase